MKRTIIIVMLLFFLSSCFQDNNESIQYSMSYVVKNNADSLSVKFVDKKDKVFVSYYFFYDHGNYLNTPSDSLDYAGFFDKNTIKKNQVVLQVKNYRGNLGDSDSLYKVKLTFLSDTSFRWTIDKKEYGKLIFLPNDVIFNLDNK